MKGRGGVDKPHAGNVGGCELQADVLLGSGGGEQGETFSTRNESIHMRMLQAAYFYPASLPCHEHATLLSLAFTDSLLATPPPGPSPTPFASPHI